MKLLMRLVSVGMLFACLLFSGAFAHAGGGDCWDGSMYFHGDGPTTPRGEHYAEITIYYNDKDVRRGHEWLSYQGFGGWTLTDVAESGTIHVSMRVHDPSGNYVDKKSWNKNFSDGKHTFRFKDSKGRWDITLKLKRDCGDVKVD